MRVYVVTKMSDYGNGFDCEVEAIKVSLDEAKVAMVCAASAEMEDLGVDAIFDDGVFISEEEIEIQYVESCGCYVKFSIHEKEL
jgi:hypothetical protein